MRVAPGPPGGGEILLAVNGVSKRYRRTTALYDVSMTARRGTVLAVVGENGTGKSTLLRLCAGLEVPDRGTVHRSGAAGYCPQEPALFDMLSAREHLTLFSAGSRAAIEEGRRLLAALEFTADPRALARDLSGGARQKLSLTLALLGQPGLLLLDEPYQGFDRGSYLNFWNIIGTWKDEGRAVVLVTHLLTELHRADEVIELGREPSGSVSCGPA